MNFNNPEVKVLREEKVGEYELTIIAVPMGHLCGYLTLPLGHPWDKAGHYDYIDADVHGNLTYAEWEEDGRYTVGFDCGHSGDAKDPQYMNKEYREATRGFMESGHIWAEFEVLEELRDLHRQAVKAEKPTATLTQLAANRPVQAVLGSNLTGQDAESNGKVFASEEEALSLVAQFNELAFRLGFANRIGIHAFVTEELI